jgi:hypothetical protein
MSTAVHNELVVLLARLIDGDGLRIRPKDVSAIECSIYEVNSYRRECTAATGYDAVSLAVENVMLDSLRTDWPWKVDDVGYNFRHEVSLGDKALTPRADAHIEVQYVLTPTSGENVRMRFQLKVS